MLNTCSSQPPKAFNRFFFLFISCKLNTFGFFPRPALHKWALWHFIGWMIYLLISCCAAWLNCGWWIELVFWDIIKIYVKVFILDYLFKCFYWCPCDVHPPLTSLYPSLLLFLLMYEGPEKAPSAVSSPPAAAGCFLISTRMQSYNFKAGLSNTGRLKADPMHFPDKQPRPTGGMREKQHEVVMGLCPQRWERGWAAGEKRAQA